MTLEKTFAELQADLQEAQTKNDKAEILLHFAKRLDTRLRLVLSSIGADSAPFEDCNLTGMELALQDYGDKDARDLDHYQNDYGFEEIC